MERRASPPVPAVKGGLLCSFQQAFFGLFLTFDAMPGPRHSFEPLGIDLFATGNTLSETAFSNASERAIHHVQELPVVVALTEEEFLVIDRKSDVSGTR